jgi:polysaccharide export outer membrane protein
VSALFPPVRRLPALALAALTAFGVGCASGSSAVEAPRSVTVSEAYRVGPGDTLTIRVLPDPAIERTGVKVRPDGKISLDLIGDVDAAGRTTEEIAATIQERISEFRQSPSVTVALELSTSTEVAVIGEVESPATFPLDREIRVSEVIAMAGDATELAATSRVRVIRRSADQTTLYLTDLDAVRGGDGTTDILLQGGDLVVVPAAYPVVGGYKLRRALYPVEAFFRAIGSGLFAPLIAAGG